MTQDQHNEEWLKEAANLAERLHYAAYTWGFDVAKCGATTDTTIAMNRAKEKLDALLAHLQQRPLPVREGADEPTAWRVRGYNQFKTSAPGPWRYFDGSTKPRVNIPSDCDFEPLFASPSVQNMGEGETGKDGVQGTLAGQRQEGGE